ncbi:MAG: 2'-5' RNA ligase family protein [Anaerolineae bacterium]|nr:2'-5' RNA ligase family protein [Anaerolineae bacterium]
MKNIVAITTIFEVDEEHPLTKILNLVNGIQESDNAAVLSPHVTWQFAEAYRPEYLDALENISKNIPKMEISINGLGLFTGRNVVLYLHVVKNRILTDLHRSIWLEVEPYAINPSPLYSPDQWIPHITIADNLSDETIFGKLVTNLMYQQTKFTTLIDNISVMTNEVSSGIGMTHRYQLQ